MLTPGEIEQAHKVERQLVILFDNLVSEYGRKVAEAGRIYFNRRLSEDRAIQNLNDVRAGKTSDPLAR